MPVGDKRLSHNVAANVAQMLIGAALLFALYRYINDTLGAAALGVWSVVLATASASRLADLGLSASVTRFVARQHGGLVVESFYRAGLLRQHGNRAGRMEHAVARCHRTA